MEELRNLMPFILQQKLKYTSKKQRFISANVRTKDKNTLQMIQH